MGGSGESSTSIVTSKSSARPTSRRRAGLRQFLQGGLEHGPDVIEHFRLAFSLRVQAVVLHQIGIERDAREQERDQWQIEFLRQIPIHGSKAVAVGGAVIDRELDTDENDRGARIARRADD